MSEVNVVILTVQSPLTVKTLNHLKVGATKSFTRISKNFFKLDNSKYLLTQKELDHLVASKQVSMFAR